MRHEMVPVRRRVGHTDTLYGADQVLVAVGEGVDQRRQPPGPSLDNAARQLHIRQHVAEHPCNGIR